MPLTRTAVVEAALAELDVGGIDAVTVRALAARLGVRAPALYWHVSSKQELLDEMGTEIQRRIVAATRRLPADATWQEQLRGYARAMRSVYLAHRDGARTFSGTRLTDPEVLRDQEESLARWEQQGVALQTTVAAFELVTAFVVGFVIEEQERAQSDDHRYDLTARDAAVGTDRPRVREVGRLLVRDPDERFEEHLDVVVAGVSSRLPRS